MSLRLVVWECASLLLLRQGVARGVVGPRCWGRGSFWLGVVMGRVRWQAYPPLPPEALLRVSSSPRTHT